MFILCSVTILLIRQLLLFCIYIVTLSGTFLQNQFVFPSQNMGTDWSLLNFLTFYYPWLFSFHDSFLKHDLHLWSSFSFTPFSANYLVSVICLCSTSTLFLWFPKCNLPCRGVSAVINDVPVLSHLKYIVK